MATVDDLEDLANSQLVRIDNQLLRAGRLVNEAAQVLQIENPTFIPDPPVNIEAAAPILNLSGAIPITNPVGAAAGDQDRGGPAPEAPELREPIGVEYTEPGDLPTDAELNTSDLFKQEAPSGTIRDFNRTAPSIQVDDLLNDIVIGDLTPLPTLELTEINIGDAPDVTLPLYEGQLPDADFGPGKDLEATFRGDYATQLSEMLSKSTSEADLMVDKYFPTLATLSSKLDEHYRKVIDGESTAWDTAVENAITQRARNRTEAEGRRLEAEIRRQAGRGGAVLELAVSTALMQAEESVYNANVAVINDTAERRKEREIQHLEFALTQAQNTRQTALGLMLQFRAWFNQTSGRAQDWARNASQVIKDAVEIAISQFNAYTDRENLNISIWDTRARNALLELEKYEKELRAESLKSQVNQDKLAERDQIIRENLSILEQANTEADIGLKRYQLRRTKLDEFLADVEAHKAYLGSKEAEGNLFSLQLAQDRGILEGKQGKLGLAQLRARIARDRADIRNADIRGLREYNGALTDIFQTQMSRWRQIREDLVNFDRLDLERDRLAHESYRTELQETSENFRLRTQAQISAAQINTDIFRSRLEEVFKRLNEANEMRRAIAQVNMEGVRAIASMVASLASTVEALSAIINETTQTAA